MAEFYVTTTETNHIDDCHHIHQANCEKLPKPEMLRYLGSFSNAPAASTKAKGFYNVVEECQHCISPT